MGDIAWRRKILNQFDQNWDIIIIGGGITGAGIFREATRIGLKTLLIDQRDFAWGTSSRSSKLVHGGLRYLKDGHLLLTRASVKERKRLLEDGKGLIDPLGFLLTIYRGDFPGRWTYEAGLSIYDLLALQWGHRYYSSDALKMLAPHISQLNLQGGFQYGDAQTDDARLVFRLIQEAIDGGGVAINYMKAVDLLEENETLKCVRVIDCETGRDYAITGKVIVNATGVWADRLRNKIVSSRVIRPLRGSHLIFPSWRLPVAQAICFLHPSDQRPVFIFPWEGVTIVGTTDVDHHEELDTEPKISSFEVSYLLTAVKAQFPSLDIDINDIISTFSGIRPVIGTGKIDPSQESREYMVWSEKGLITVTGGKLTTFRLIALEVLNSIRSRIPNIPPINKKYPVLNQIRIDDSQLMKLDVGIKSRLIGRYGIYAESVIKIGESGEMDNIPGTDTLWAELRWAARSEYICHLDDLMLRRNRLGLILPEGGERILEGVKQICQSELRWDDDRWETEKADYLDLWKSNYYLPDKQISIESKQDQNEIINLKLKKFETLKIKERSKPFLKSGVLLFLAGIGYFFWKKSGRVH